MAEKKLIALRSIAVVASAGVIGMFVSLHKSRVVNFLGARVMNRGLVSTDIARLKYARMTYLCKLLTYLVEIKLDLTLLQG